MNILITLCCSVLCIAQPCFGQIDSIVNIVLKNPSFEGIPRQSTAPKGWGDCGFPGESETDIHPGNYWGVNQTAYQGNTYLGMVVRNNGTWERIYQKLSSPMIAGTCYQFTIKLCTAEKYVSKVIDWSRFPNMETDDSTYNFNTPCILKIWGSNAPCGRKQLLDQSVAVENTEWKTYRFTFKPEKNYRFILLEAYYNSFNFTKLYNGNILLDDASDIIPIACKE